MPNRVGWFLAELKRRRVYRVAVAYGVVAFVIWQLADIAFPALGLPDSGITLVLIFTILGFPLALVLAWAYEVTPAGVRQERAPAGGGAVASGVSKPRASAAGESAPGVVSAPTGEPGSRSEVGRRGPSSRGASVAVLPFANLGPSPEGDFFSDGITEEITHALARSPGLKVVARSSAFAFKDRSVDVREVGRLLGVSHLLEGSVRRSGDRLRVTAQLIETEAGTHLWSERYDRELDDVFAIQDEIAGHIAARLAGALSGAGDPSSARSATSVEAYDAYLRARQQHARFDPRSLSTAIDGYREAIALDPEFAPAHAALAQAYTSQSIGLGVPSRDTMPLARAAAERALALAPELADAHLARALVAMFYDWDHEGAKRGIDRAIELKPSYAEAHLWEEFYWTYVRARYEEAVVATRRAQELDPLDPTVKVRLGAVYFLFGRPGQAVDYFEDLLSEDPDVPLFYMSLGDARGRAGDLEGAVSACERSVELLGGARRAPNGPLGVLGVWYAIARDAERAKRVLDVLGERSGSGSVTAFWEGGIRAGLGDMDGAFAALERAVGQRDCTLLYLNAAPRELGLRADPRYETLRRRIGLPDVS